MFKSFLPLAAVVALIATPAAAAPPVSSAIDGEFLTISVSGADIDLSSPGGQQTMRGRVDGAVWRVCDAAIKQGLTRVFDPLAFGECRFATRDAAEQQLAALFARASRGEKVASLVFKLRRAVR